MQQACIIYRQSLQQRGFLTFFGPGRAERALVKSGSPDFVGPGWALLARAMNGPGLVGLKPGLARAAISTLRKHQNIQNHHTSDVCCSATKAISSNTEAKHQ